LQEAVARLIALATRGTALPVRAMRAKSRVETLFDSLSSTQAQYFSFVAFPCVQLRMKLRMIFGE
jgi:hypothetical protein